MNNLYMLNRLAKEIGKFLPFPVFFTIGDIKSKDMYSSWLDKIGGVTNRINWDVDNLQLQKYAESSGKEDVYGEKGGTVSDNILVAFRSNISPAVNFVFEQLFVWSLISPLQFHHFGQSYRFTKQMQEAIQKDEDRFGTNRIYPRSMPEHCFVPNVTGEYFCEHVYESSINSKSYHVEFCYSKPEDVVKFVMDSLPAKALGIGSCSNSEGSISIYTPCPGRNYNFRFKIAPVWRDPRTL